MAKIPYIDNVNVVSPICEGIAPATASIDVRPEIKLWSLKESHTEVENPGKGDDISFVLVFGNDGELPCPADTTNPTLEDTLDISSPIDLKLMSFCISDQYELWVVAEDGVVLTTPYQVLRCEIFESGIYQLQLRKKVDEGPATPYFAVPCHFICCIAMLFQIEFPACDPCPDDCHNRPLINPSFENDFVGWNKVDNQQPNTITQEQLFNCSSSSTNFAPHAGNYFALLTTDGANATTALYQTISVCPGDTIQGWAFFCTQEAVSRTPDVANIRIIRSDGSTENIPFTRNSNGGSDSVWQPWSYTFLNGGIYTLRAEVINNNNVVLSYLGVDDISLV
ncbi:hypothetical protein [Clostridium uliginosum]|uniref:Uncharacterized protein n=1 Tax=Clostridium uliginosum TaxID=119641 RepID=A0A1I1N4N0_9CLOT|nr:hypothetical protein [Clostridium uliginosum]SFC90438.1 hypothetical protein SAMN05421842_1137 [Clostridium uliginosum]